MREYVDGTALVAGDVIEPAPGASWRTVTDVTEPRHALAAAHGGTAVHTVLWNDGRVMPVITLIPGTGKATVCRVRRAGDVS